MVAAPDAVGRTRRARPVGPDATAPGGHRRHRRPGRLALIGGIGLSLGVAGDRRRMGTGPASAGTPPRIEISIHFSHFSPSTVSVPLGVPVTFVLRNDDPIDHEWIVGDAAVHERHRTGTEPVHASRPTEVSIPAGAIRVTTVTFPVTGEWQFICHLPGHEAYGMVGTVRIGESSGARDR